MSYCRLSSDNFKCDIYCYEDVMGGYTIHIARNKIKDQDKIPEVHIEDLKNHNFTKFTEDLKVQFKYLETCEREDIDLPYAGETLNVSTLVDLVAKLTELKMLGYNIPNYVFEDIEEEIKDG